LREAQVAASLDHSNIVQYIGLFIRIDPHDLFIVSDFIDGLTARAFLSKYQTPRMAEKVVSDATQ
jgi:serine/threonine protein kinase